MEKYKDIADWEGKVESVDTIDRGSDGLIVYMTMWVFKMAIWVILMLHRIGGEKVAQPSDVAYKRCPMKVGVYGSVDLV
jgi:hypothetical protein